MTSRHCLTAVESDDRALWQYESLRGRVLKKKAGLSVPNRGLALFIRQGMLAWIQICHKCLPESSTLDKQTETCLAADEIKSEMIKVLANITLLNLQEVHP